MKKNLLNILSCLSLFFFSILVTACTKAVTQAQYNSEFPSGNYTGQFRRIHRNAAKGTYDTLFANIKLSLNATTGFTVTGDTTTVHAGSMGAFAFGTTNVLFSDKTYPTSGTPTKVHLNGSYLYYFNTPVLQFLQSSSDTLSYQYDLKAN